MRNKIKLENSLAYKYPNLLDEWHPTKNGNLNPEDVKGKSDKKVWWKCEKGHEWEVMIAKRSSGSGCPYCSGHRVLKGENDLATVNPELAKEWHPMKNGNLKAEDVTKASGKKVWWQCEKGHEWERKVGGRSSFNNGCPYCSGHRVIKGETDLLTRNPALSREWHPLKNSNLGPDDVKVGSNKKVWWRCIKGHEWESSIVDRTANSRGCPFCSGRIAAIGETDLLTVNPELAKQWHPTKNGNLKSENVTARSAKKVWWQCEKEHEWRASIVNRRRTGCPFCSGKLVIKGETDLATKNPYLAEEWHPTRNGNLKPEQVTARSGKKAWWQCVKGHEWESIIDWRNKKGCPYCSGRRVIIGETDLATLNPDLAEEWHLIKNGNMKPKDLSTGSQRKVWWQCEKGHEWEASIGSRVYFESGCPYCLGKKAIKGETDLLTVSPKLAEEWHLTKNGNLKSNDVTARSNKIIWWQCEKGHEWKSSVSNRYRAGCPYCSGKQAIKGETDLESLNPELAKEWHPTKNANLKPDAVTANSGRKVWWICANNHEWRSIIGVRSKGTWCKVCRKNKS